MNQKDRSLLELIRRSPSPELEPSPALDGLVTMVMEAYGLAIHKDVLFHSHIGLIPREETEHAMQLVALNFIALVREYGEVPRGMTIRQILHLLTVQVALGFHPASKVAPPDYQKGLIYKRSELPWKSTEIQNRLFNSMIETLTGGLYYVEHRQNIIFESEERMTARFLSSTLMPYVGAIADMQRVCNAVLRRADHEVVIKSISQNSPMDIKLVDAAEAINALKEDIIPWRRENAKKLAKLKEKEVAADIKKKEAEALEIRARSTKEDAESEKLRAEAAKMMEEAEQLRLENEKRRFELQKAKFQLALEIVSKMQPDLPPADVYVHAMQLLPAIDTLSTSPIEPNLLGS